MSLVLEMSFLWSFEVFILFGTLVEISSMYYFLWPKGCKKMQRSILKLQYDLRLSSSRTHLMVSAVELKMIKVRGR